MCPKPKKGPTGSLELPQGTGTMAGLWLCHSPSRASRASGNQLAWEYQGLESPGKKEVGGGGHSTTRMMSRTKALEAARCKQTPLCPA